MGTYLKKYFLWVITVLFFIIMVFFTVSARKIHNAMLPNVIVENPEKRDFLFLYIDQNGTKGEVYQKRLSISKEILGNPVYVVYEDTKNGETRVFVKAVQVETGMDNGEYVEVLSGLSRNDRVVVSSTMDLWDGAEVYIVEK